MQWLVHKIEPILMTANIPPQQPASRTAEQTLQQAIAHHQAGQLQEAGELYLTILKTDPNHPEANHNMGVLAVQMRQPAAGLPYFIAALDADPARGSYWSDYIDALFQAGQLEDARQVLALARQQGLEGDEVDALALRLKGGAQAAEQPNTEHQHASQESLPVSPAAPQNSAKSPSPQEVDALLALFNEGRFTEVATLAQMMTERFPLHAFGWKALGTVFQQMGRSEDALAPMQKAAALSPGEVEAHNNLGMVLQDLNRLDKAEVSFRQALQIKPDYAEAHSNLGATLKELGRLDESEASYRRALQINPDFAEAHSNLGNTLKYLGRLDEAEASYRRALQIKPDHAEAYNNLGVTLQKLGRMDESEDSLRRALQIKPDYAEAHSNLGITLLDMGRLAESEVSLRRALQIKPDLAEAHNNLGNILKDMGRLDEAETSYRRALQIKPDYAQAYSNLLFLHGYHALIDPQEYLAQARNWEQACVPAQDRQAARHRIFQRPPLAGRRLRVGYVSGDYHQHAVSYFIEQIFAYHDKAQIELFLYSTNGKRDAVTERLQALAEHWVPLSGIPDAAIRERIEADAIDVLIDLSGHTGHHRMGVFARRAAPVQAHYLGFFASTGLTEMDYWIGDEVLTPAGTDSHFSERVWRLPRVWVSYDGKADAPVSAWQPGRDGVVWLGSFNNLGKLTPATLVLWTKVLHALPEGKLLLKTKELADAGNRQRILDAMAGHGITPDRIELQDRSATPDWSAHMAYYDRLDIALDPVGGCGRRHHHLRCAVDGGAGHRP